MYESPYSSVAVLHHAKRHTLRNQYLAMALTISLACQGKHMMKHFAHRRKKGFYNLRGEIALQNTLTFTESHSCSITPEGFSVPHI